MDEEPDWKKCGEENPAFTKLSITERTMKMMRAKMRVTSISPIYGETNQDLTFSAVSKSDGYPSDGSDENNSFARWTPTAELRMSVTNPNLTGKFEIGQEFYVDFTPCV